MPALESILDRKDGTVIGYVSARRDILGKFAYYDPDRRLLGGRQTKTDAAQALRARIELDQAKRR